MEMEDKFTQLSRFLEERLRTEIDGMKMSRETYKSLSPNKRTSTLTGGFNKTSDESLITSVK